MNDPQFWGAVRGVLIALGGAVAGFGLMSAGDWTIIVDRTIAVATAMAGLVAVVWPMYQGWKSRSRKAIIATVADQPGVQKVVTDAATANAIPSPKVVGPNG
jgi:hypothetical protein